MTIGWTFSALGQTLNQAVTSDQAGAMYDIRSVMVKDKNFCKSTNVVGKLSRRLCWNHILTDQVRRGEPIFQLIISISLVGSYSPILMSLFSSFLLRLLLTIGGLLFICFSARVSSMIFCTRVGGIKFTLMVILAR